MPLRLERGLLEASGCDQQLFNQSNKRNKS